MPEADLAIVGASVVTCDSARPRAEALAVRGGRLVAVGTEREIRRWCGRRTALVEAGGRTVLPGFVDAHVHPPMAGIEMARCDLTGLAGRREYLEAIGRYAAQHPDEAWIRGGGWSMAAFPGGVPRAADLDAVVGERPVYLPNRDHHSAWVSSRALGLAGVTAATPDPPDGRIERDPDGTPTGALHEGAMGLVEAALPRLGLDDYAEGILAAQRYLHSLGITSWQDAWVPVSGEGAGALEAYLALASSGRLTARVVGALWWERDRGLEQVDDLVEARRRAAELGSDRFRATSVKIMQDGVCETFTAAMLTPYLDSHGHETGNCGLSFVEPEALKDYVARLDAESFQVHVHAIGDRAVRDALDAFSFARARNPSPGALHHLAHLQVVHPDDLDRFAPLGLTANFQPLWAQAEPQMVDLTLPFLGPERAAQQYPIGSLLRRSVPMAFGSDWPVSTPDPFAQLHVAVTRTPPPGEEGSGEAPPFLPDERIALAEALGVFTGGSARVNGLGALAGSLSVGKAADLVLLDRDLHAAAADGEIASCSASLTLVGGEAVFEAPATG